VRRRNNLWMVRQTKIVVGTQVDYVPHAAIAADIDRRLLRSRDKTFRLVQPLGFKCLGLFCEGLEKDGGHKAYLTGAKRVRIIARHHEVETNVVGHLDTL